jgi:hypothetical protein
MLKSLTACAAALSLAGCAAFGTEESADLLTEARVAKAPADGSLQPVSLGSGPRLKSSQPLGLAPCRVGVFRAGACWRKGDEHYVYEDPLPDGLEVSSLTPRGDSN